MHFFIVASFLWPACTWCRTNLSFLRLGFARIFYGDLAIFAWWLVKWRGCWWWWFGPFFAGEIVKIGLKSWWFGDWGGGLVPPRYWYSYNDTMELIAGASEPIYHFEELINAGVVWSSTGSKRFWALTSTIFNQFGWNFAWW